MSNVNEITSISNFILSYLLFMLCVFCSKIRHSKKRGIFVLCCFYIKQSVDKKVSKFNANHRFPMFKATVQCWFFVKKIMARKPQFVLIQIYYWTSQRHDNNTETNRHIASATDIEMLRGVRTTQIFVDHKPAIYLYVVQHNQMSRVRIVRFNFTFVRHV